MPHKNGCGPMGKRPAGKKHGGKKAAKKHGGAKGKKSAPKHSMPTKGALLGGLLGGLASLASGLF